MEDDARDVRPGEQLDWARLGAWLRERLPACSMPGLDVSREPEVAQFPGGHSNLTYLVRFGDVEHRRAASAVRPGAADGARHGARVPLAVGDARRVPAGAAAVPALRGPDRHRLGVLRDGAPPRHGRPRPRSRPRSPTSRSSPPPQRGDDRHARRSARHRRRPRRRSRALGKPAGFVERQVRGWTERWHRSKTTPLPEMDALADMAARSHLPADPAQPSVVHGDFKLDNVMLDPRRRRPHRRGVRLGDERARRSAGRPGDRAGLLVADGAARAARRADDGHRSAGLFHAATRSSSATRRGPAAIVSDIRYYEIFALFKIAVVIQQIYYRYVAGPDQRRAVRHLRRARRVIWRGTPRDLPRSPDRSRSRWDVAFSSQLSAFSSQLSALSCRLSAVGSQL